MKRALLVSITLVACSAAPPATVSTARSVTTPQPIRCNGGRELVFTRKLANGDVSHVTLRCTDEHVIASIDIFEKTSPEDLDAAPQLRASGGPVEVDHALFDRVWRGAFARADERGCQRRRARDFQAVVTLRDTHDKREITCFDLDIDDVVEPLRAVVKVAPPLPVTNPETWPFQGEYWKDELGYYRAR